MLRALERRVAKIEAKLGLRAAGETNDDERGIRGEPKRAPRLDAEARPSGEENEPLT